MTITDETIDVLTSCEAFASSTLTIAGGTMTIEATDDGINLSDPNNTSTSFFDGERPNDNLWLLISGGTITIVAGSDAIDSNGNASMTGGTVDLTAATLGEGETIDVNGTWEQTGGDLTETGGNSMNGPGGMGGPDNMGERPDNMGERPDNMGDPPDNMPSNGDEMGNPFQKP